MLSANIAVSEKNTIERCHKDNSKKAALIYIARGGIPLLDIVIPETPAVPIKEATDDLARCLKKMTGSDFKVIQSSKIIPGIIIGRPADFPGTGLEKNLVLKRIEDRQHYILKQEKI